MENAADASWVHQVHQANPAPMVETARTVGRERTDYLAKTAVLMSLHALASVHAPLDSPDHQDNRANPASRAIQEMQGRTASRAFRVQRARLESRVHRARQAPPDKRALLASRAYYRRATLHLVPPADPATTVLLALREALA